MSRRHKPGNLAFSHAMLGVGHASSRRASMLSNSDDATDNGVIAVTLAPFMAFCSSRHFDPDLCGLLFGGLQLIFTGLLGEFAFHL
jgi:hypothetical protein